MARSIRWQVAIAAWMAAALFIPLAGAAQEMQPIRLVSGPGYAPFVGPDLPGGGMLSEIVTAGFAAAGLTTAPVAFEPWLRAVEATAAGRYDATFPYRITDERLSRFIFSDPLLEVKVVAVFTTASGREYTGPESLRGMRLCNPLGFALNPAVSSLVESGAIEEIVSPDVSSCLRMLQHGRLDVFIGNEFLVRYALRCTLGGMQGVQFNGQPVGHSTLHLTVPVGRPGGEELVKAFNAGLTRLRATGEWQRVAERHLTGPFGCVPEPDMDGEGGHRPPA